MHYNCEQKLLSSHKFVHSVFTRRKIITKVFNIFFWDYLDLTSWKVNNPARLWPQHFQLRGVTVSTTAVKILEMYLSGVNLNSFLKSTPSKIFSNRFNQICRTQVWKTSLRNCFWKVLPHFDWSKYFFFIFN